MHRNHWNRPKAGLWCSKPTSENADLAGRGVSSNHSVFVESSSNLRLPDPKLNLHPIRSNSGAVLLEHSPRSPCSFKFRTCEEPLPKVMCGGW